MHWPLQILCLLFVCLRCWAWNSRARTCWTSMLPVRCIRDLFNPSGQESWLRWSSLTTTTARTSDKLDTFPLHRDWKTNTAYSPRTWPLRQFSQGLLKMPVPPDHRSSLENTMPIFLRGVVGVLLIIWWVMDICHPLRDLVASYYCYDAENELFLGEEA